MMVSLSNFCSEAAPSAGVGWVAASMTMIYPRRPDLELQLPDVTSAQM
jgi:hypothetical protein